MKKFNSESTEHQKLEKSLFIKSRFDRLIPWTI
jgi:hypothetical protein